MKKILTLLMVLCAMICFVACDIENSDLADMANGVQMDDWDDIEGTASQKQAVRKARSYLDAMAFSYQGLIEQLEFEQFSTEDATFGADNCGADWNEQAVRKAKSYLDTMAFSYKGLIDQLEYEKFTTEQATYGVDNCGADWNEQAVLKAKSYLDTMAFSRDGLIDQLIFEGFTAEQAAYGATKNGL